METKIKKTAMKISINKIEIKITKSEIRDAIKSELRFDFGVVARDSFSVLVMSVRTIDFEQKGLFSLKEKVNYVYENAKQIIENAAFHHTPIANYFGLPNVQ